ncbi:MAG: DNA-formamidopyrimidine glycosylase family protein [Vulcanimicrobiota bacterium]
MPEGDTVHKVAEVIRKELNGRVLTDCRVRGVYGSERLAGSKVLEVRALGKHMLVAFDRDLQLRVHLGMKGSWHRYPAGIPWKKPRQSAVVVLSTASTELALFNAQEVELIPTPQLKWHRQLSHLGPDLLAASEPDWTDIVARCYRYRQAEDPLGEVLLDQRVAAGIGNVYKSELAFLGPLEEDAFKPAETGLSPHRVLSDVCPEQLKGLYRRARPLLQANLGGWSRTTRVDRRQTPAPKVALYVYERPGEECFRCGKTIQAGFQGLQNRVTFWCDGCQTR